MNRTSDTRRRPNPLFTVLCVTVFAVMGALAILAFINGHLIAGGLCTAVFIELFVVADRRVRKARCTHEDASAGGDRGER